MIQIDISNIWGGVSLADLLELEREVSAAHMAAAGTEEEPARFAVGEDAELTERLQTAARVIRGNSDVVIVVAEQETAACARGVMELLQGVYRNFGLPKGIPQIFFAGESFSARSRNELVRLLEGRDFSLILADDDALEGALASRSLRWMLERRYGAEGARSRIYAAAAEGSALFDAAAAQGWELFPIAQDKASAFSAAVLLPLAVAGVDIHALLEGAMAEAKELELRSFENPMWLYAAVRTLLFRKGRTTEFIGTTEPCFAGLGKWWRLLFGKLGGAIPSVVEIPAQLPGCEPILLSGRHGCFETAVNFAPPKSPGFIGSDLQNWDGLNDLAGSSLSEVQREACAAAVNFHADAGVSVMSLDFGQRSAEGAGRIVYFLGMSCAICREIIENDGINTHETKNYRDELLKRLKKTEQPDDWTR